MGKMLSWAICLLWANCQFGQKIFGQNVFMGKLSYWAWCLWAKCYLGQYIFGHFEKLGISTFNRFLSTISTQIEQRCSNKSKSFLYAVLLKFCMLFNGLKKMPFWNQIFVIVHWSRALFIGVLIVMSTFVILYFY